MNSTCERLRACHCSIRTGFQPRRWPRWRGEVIRRRKTVVSGRLAMRGWRPKVPRNNVGPAPGRAAHHHQPAQGRSPPREWGIDQPPAAIAQPEEQARHRTAAADRGCAASERRRENPVQIMIVIGRLGEESGDQKAGDDRCGFVEMTEVGTGSDDVERDKKVAERHDQGELRQEKHRLRQIGYGVEANLFARRTQEFARDTASICGHGRHIFVARTTPLRRRVTLPYKWIFRLKAQIARLP